MLYICLLLLPPLLNTLAIFYLNIVRRAYWLRLFCLLLIVFITLYSIFYPFSSHLLIRYTCAFFLSWYLIWSVNILFVFDIRSFRRFRVRQCGRQELVCWESVYQTAGLNRLIWALDLSTNFRGLGWRSTRANAAWPSRKHQERLKNSMGLLLRVQKLAVRGVILFGIDRFLRTCHQSQGSVNLALYQLP